MRMFLVTFALFLSTTAQHAQAATVGPKLDQAPEVTEPYSAGLTVADGYSPTQTFTAGINGLFYAIDVNVQRKEFTTETLNLELFAINGSSLNSLVSISKEAAEVSFDFNDPTRFLIDQPNILSVAGQEYLI